MLLKINLVLFCILSVFAAAPAELCPELTSEWHKEQIIALYPNHNIKCDMIVSTVSYRSRYEGVFSVEGTDPELNGIYMVLRRVFPVTSTCQPTTPLTITAKPGSLQVMSVTNYKKNLRYTKLDGQVQAQKLELEIDKGQFIRLDLTDAIPSHPTILNWDDIKLGDDGSLLFAGQSSNINRYFKYWAFSDEQWHLLCEGEFHLTRLKNIKNKVYKFSIINEALTIEYLDDDRFIPTNVTDCAVSCIQGKFIFLNKDPMTAIAVATYDDGYQSFRFLEANQPCVLASAAETPQTRPEEQYLELISKVQQRWLEEKRPYASDRFSINQIATDGEDRITRLHFSFPNAELRGIVKVNTPAIGTECLSIEYHRDTTDYSPHPPLVLHSASVETYRVPYYYVPPAQLKNNKTMIIMQGGPNQHYNGDFASTVDEFTKNGWSVIIPQESLRTGYGWGHYERGLGEMGRKNLHELLHIFYDAADKELIPDVSQVSLYGHSYGGFVAVSFAQRWRQLHEEAGMPIGFSFQHLIADAALVNFDLSSKILDGRMLPSDLVEATDVEGYLQRVMPIHQALYQAFSAPLTLVHGKFDVRCSAADMRNFHTKLYGACQNVPLFWHEGAHNPPENQEYPKFLRAIMEGRSADVARLAAVSGLTEAIT